MENPRLKQLISERRLSAIYFACACLSIIGLVTTAVVLGYWHETLNMCLGQEKLGYKHCGCLLYAKSTFKIFVGSETMLCHFVQYSNIPGIVIGLILGVIHWYRISFVLNKIPKSKRKRRPIVPSFNDNDTQGAVVVVQRPSLFATISWITCAIIVLIIALMTFTSAVLLTDGSIKACGAYRQNIIETIQANGNMAVLIKERLFCNAIFDFMDYLEPIKFRHSANFINTGAGITIAIFAVWLAVIGWVMATISCIYEAFRYRNCPCKR